MKVSGPHFDNPDFSEFVDASTYIAQGDLEWKFVTSLDVATMMFYDSPIQVSVLPDGRFDEATADQMPPEAVLVKYEELRAGVHNAIREHLPSVPVSVLNGIATMANGETANLLRVQKLLVDSFVDHGEQAFADAADDLSKVTGLVFGPNQELLFAKHP